VFELPIDIRPFMAGFPSGVSVVTALGEQGRPLGTTCSSLCSVALDPPTLAVCLHSESGTLRAALASGRFSLNLLSEDAEEVSRRFAAPVEDRFAGVEWRLPYGASGPHLTADAHATADCLIANAVAVGDHTVLFGDVERVSVRESEARPLLYGQRRYARWSDAVAGAEPLLVAPAEATDGR